MPTNITNFPYNLTGLFSQAKMTASTPMGAFPSVISHNFGWFFPLAILFIAVAIYLGNILYCVRLRGCPSPVIRSQAG